ncbi:MAG: alpha-N-arabinofuranosidase [Defluviitaleaceae bacterium]|nr:alpha-N-arabinofuranosidase [Defluviitaleaceae bacterium]
MRRLIINPDKKGEKISRNIYGHFAEHLGRCIYEGIYVGEGSPIPNVKGMRSDVVSALRGIKVPVLRWPGGCFADIYHWMDGIGPAAQRKKIINTHWGGVVEDNSFGTHEFMELCAQIGCDPFISGNVGSGTVREMSEWVEYMTFGGVSPMADLRGANGQKEPWSVPYFGIGNENWGCGGNMSAEYYASIYRHYQTYVREYDGNQISKIACGPNIDDYHWTEVMMSRCHSRTPHTNGADYRMDGLSLHYYTSPGGPKDRGCAVKFDEIKYFHTLSDALRMDKLISGHSLIMDRYDPEKRVGLVVDEWGTWFDVAEGTNPGFLYQQNTMRDALVAGVTLNIFNTHCDRVTMANIAQTVNVLQAVILTQGEQMIKTPTYHVFDLYKGHQDAQLLESYVDDRHIGTDEYSVPELHVSASQDDSSAILATLVNLSLHDTLDICCQLCGHQAKSASARVLTGKMDAHNDFDAPERVKPRHLDEITISGEKLLFQIPPCAVMEIVIDIGPVE